MCFLTLRSETDSLTEPAKQRYKRFSFCHDTFYPAKQNQPEPGFSLPCLPNWANWQNAFFSLFALCSIGLCPQLWGLCSKSLLTLILLIEGSISNLALLQSCCDRVLLLLFLLILLIEGARLKCNPYPNLALLLFRSCCNLAVHVLPDMGNALKSEGVMYWTKIRGEWTGLLNLEHCIFSTPQFSGMPMKKGCIQIWTPPPFLVCLPAYLLHWFS